MPTVKYRYKKAVQKPVGEFKCPYCKKVFHRKQSLAGHIGGAHRKYTTRKEKPHCKFCDKRLIEGRNWPMWAVKQRNLICTPCKREQNRRSYQNRIATKANKK